VPKGEGIQKDIISRQNGAPPRQAREDSLSARGRGSSNPVFGRKGGYETLGVIIGRPSKTPNKHHERIPSEASMKGKRFIGRKSRTFEKLGD